MTVRFIICDQCFRQGNFTEFVSCPVCRKSLCQRCAVGEPLKAGHCGRRVACHGVAAHPAAEGAEPAPAAPPRPEPLLPALWRRLRRKPGRRS